MANNPFTASQNVDNNVHRSVFDQSHQVNLTTKLGQITPFMCKEVLPGDSVKIRPELGLRFMPLVFPIQTRMRAYVHFFYVRNRSLWKDWPDFIYGTKKNLAPPYLSSDSPVSFKTGAIADYLGVPTTIYSATEGSSAQISLVGYTMNNSSGTQVYKSYYQLLSSLTGSITQNIAGTDMNGGGNLQNYYVFLPLPLSGTVGKSVNMQLSSPVTPALTSVQYALIRNGAIFARTKGTPIELNWDSQNRTSIVVPDVIDGVKLLPSDQFALISASPSMVMSSNWNSSSSPVTLTLSLLDSTSITLDLSSVVPSQNPFLNGKQPLSAFPFRAYESIYNAYYRNQQNDPYRINGEIEYNKWIPSDDGGADSNEYKLYFRNWEQDIFTTCLPSPQQGDNPPLVGITTLNGEQLTAFQSEDGIVHTVKFSYDESTKTIKTADISDSDEDTVNGRTFYSLMDAATSGITINDLRSVNALQKFLELQMRKGFRYKDLTKGHFDVDIKFDELNMPEFVAGFNQDVFVNQITSTSASQTVDSDGETVDAPLGSWAGQAGAFGNMKDFTRYFDEHGYLIGLLTIVPVPVYTQTLPKHFTKFNKFDYYFPEFANIGMQEVPKSLLAPLQYYNDTDAQKNPTFGYQRPWYEYCSELDTAHGEFRTTLRNFLMNRVFGNTPSLGHDFLAVDPKQLNDVFISTDEVEDKILGEVYLHMSYKTSVPFVSIPKIE